MDTGESLSSFAAWLTVNRSCNLSCKWCYANPSRFKDVPSMSLDTARRSVDFFAGLPLKKVILIGGEPTIHRDFITIVQIVKKAGLNPTLITNGIKFCDDEFLRESINAGITGITISLKGSSNKQYEKLTGKPVFDKVMQATQNISKSEIDHVVSITIGDDLCNDFDGMIEAVKKSQTKSVSFEMERPMIVDNKVLSSGQMSPREKADFFVSIFPLLEKCGIDFVLKVSIPFCLFPNGFIEMLKEKKRIASGCLSSHTYCTL